MVIPKAEIEEINLNFEIDVLNEQVTSIASKYIGNPSVSAIDSFPLLTGTGETINTYDGLLPCINGPMDRNPSASDLMKFNVKRKSQDSKIMTELCVGPLRNVLHQLDSLGFWPRGARINCMKPHSSTVLHKDTVIDQYAVSLHVPIITNDKCYCIINNKKFVLPALGSAFLCNINMLHQFFNEGDSPRYHLVCAVWDTKSISKNFRFQFDYIPRDSSFNY